MTVQWTHALVLDTSDLPVLTEAEVLRLREHMAARMAVETELVMLAGYPPGYDHRTGMPGALHLDAKPSRYGRIIDFDTDGWA